MELDCWDGDNGQPLITHGRTVCTRIKLWDALKAIKKSAFVSSPYPVILSIEDHCSVQQQTEMARMLRDIFGDALLDAPVEQEPSQNLLPSPDQLRGKVIVKHKVPSKTNRTVLSNGIVAMSTISADEEDEDIRTEASVADLRIACSMKIGDESDFKQVAITCDEYGLGIRCCRFDDTEEDHVLKVHESEEDSVWPITQEVAEEAFTLLGDQLKEGFYLLRRHSGLLDISVFCSGAVRSIRIKEHFDGAVELGGKTFKDGLAQMLAYFSNSALEIQAECEASVSVTLSRAVPKDLLVKTQTWYMPGFSEEDADRFARAELSSNIPQLIMNSCSLIRRLLFATQKDGTFMVWGSPDRPGCVVLSFFSKGIVCHVSVDQEGSHCKLGAKSKSPTSPLMPTRAASLAGGLETNFRSLLDVIEHFSRVPITDCTLLTTPYSGPRPPAGAEQESTP